jgi:hypothetical protein
MLLFYALGCNDPLSEYDRTKYRNLQLEINLFAARESEFAS